MLKKVKLLQTFFPPVRLRAQSADIWLLVKENDQSGRSWQDKNKESEERLGQGWARKKKDGMRRLRGGEGGGKTRWQGGGNREIEEGKKCIHRCGGILTFLKSLNLEPACMFYDTLHLYISLKAKCSVLPSTLFSSSRPECLVMKREGAEVCQEEIALAVMHPNLLRAAAAVRLLFFQKEKK